ncbi:dienelactone hydrolase [Bradyrhizobium sp. LM4.3]
MGTAITFKRPDGKDGSGYLANTARGNAPGVVVIQEWWGLSDQIKGLCDRFALAGFDALAPDLYKGKVVPYHDTDAAGKEMNSLDFMDPPPPRRPCAAPRNICRAMGPRWG